VYHARGEIFSGIYAALEASQVSTCSGSQLVSAGTHRMVFIEYSNCQTSVHVGNSRKLLLTNSLTTLDEPAVGQPRLQLSTNSNAPFSASLCTLEASLLDDDFDFGFG
jgi:hypothetical protein